MKKQREQELWQNWLQQILSADEYTVFYYYSNYKNLDKASTALAMSATDRKRHLTRSFDKIRFYFKTYSAIEQTAKIHLYTKKQFLEAPLIDLDLSCRTYHLLNGADLRNMRDVIACGITGLYRIRGFGEKSLIELKSVLRGSLITYLWNNILLPELIFKESTTSIPFI